MELDIRTMAKELAENVYYDGMIFYVLENGDYGVTPQGSAYWPIKKVWDISLDKWYWRDGLAEAGITDDDVENVSDSLIDYIIESELQYEDWDTLLSE